MVIRPLAPVGRLSKQNGTGSRGMTTTDEELVARAQGGDIESFNQLIVRWERPIYALAYRVIGREEDARDVCQDAFLRAYRALPGFKGQAKFSSWLYRIALNLCRDWIRRQRRAPVSQLPEDMDAIERASETGPVESIEDLVARRELSAIVEEAMSELSEEQRTAIILKDIPRDDVPGDRGHAGLSAEHGEDTALSRPVAAASTSGATGASDARTGETRMNDIFQCGDSAALVAYLYDECAPDERALITAHLKGCATCASEIDALSATRRTLAAWTPPELALGFRITREDEPRPAKVLEPKIAWWRAPLPAWAQAAAALVIFGVGLSVGAARNSAPEQAAKRRPCAPFQSRPSRPFPACRETISRSSSSDSRRSSRSSGPRLSATPVVARGSDEALLAQVKTLIEQSEENQRRDFTVRMVDIAGNIETQRRVDLASVRQQIGMQQGAIGTELRQQREVLGRLVSERTR